MPPPAGLIGALDQVAERIHAASAALGDAVVVDPLAELAVRASTHGFRRRGRTTCGGAGRLLRCDGGWLALTLARQADVDLVPALVETAVDLDDPWGPVTEWCRTMPVTDAEARGVLLGLPVAAVGAANAVQAVTTTRRGTALGGTGRLVVDLSSMWAGPLCGALLARAGFDVVKLEAVNRPDGTRHGPEAFFTRMNGAKRTVTFDPRTADGRRRLAEAIEAADVVIEASRPRALQQLGIDRDAMASGPRVWVSITAHGREGDAADRVGFGDDTAAAGGLVVWDDDGPLFCADAVGDPITGLVAAAHTLEAVATGGRCHIDVAMAGVAARCSDRE